MSYQPGMYEDVHGNFIPFIVLGILWWKRKELLTVPLRSWWPGMFILMIGLFFHLVGYRVQQPRISIAGLFTGIYGLAGIAWGPLLLRKTFFPFILFLFSIPLGTLVLPITFKLRMLVSQIVEGICHFILVDIVREGTSLHDPGNHYAYEVAAACSGIRSLIVTFLLATVYAMVGFKAWWRRGLLIGSAIPFAVIGNVLRMLAIVLSSEWISPSWGKEIHEGGVWSLLPYVPAFFGLLWLGQRLERGESRKSAGQGRPDDRVRGPMGKTSAIQSL